MGRGLPVAYEAGVEEWGVVWEGRNPKMCQGRRKTGDVRKSKKWRQHVNETGLPVHQSIPTQTLVLHKCGLYWTIECVWVSEIGSKEREQSIQWLVWRKSLLLWWLPVFFSSLQILCVSIFCADQLYSLHFNVGPSNCQANDCQQLNYVWSWTRALINCVSETSVLGRRGHPFSSSLH